jgi:hypothetical protein
MFCGVSLAVSGYSEACPARPEEENRRPAARRQTLPAATAAFHRPTSSVHAVICYRCRSSIVPRIVQQNVVRGAVDMPLPGHHHLLMPIQGARYHMECPECGAPFADDDAIRELNGELSEEASKALWIGIGIFAIVVLIIIVSLMWNLPWE